MKQSSNTYYRFYHGIDWLARTGIGILFALINCWLLLLSGFSTSYIATGSSEKTFFVPDSMLLNLTATVLIFLILFCLRKKAPAVRSHCSFASWMNFDRTKQLLLTFSFVCGVLWILSTQIVPGADQAAVVEAAAGLHTKSYALFAPGEYISRFPHQIGMVTVLYALGFVFGDANFLVFQLCNVGGFVLIEKVLSELAGMFGLNKRGQLMVLVLCILFLPLPLYSSFVYGNILGLSFSLFAIQQELFLFRTGCKRHALFSAFAIALAVFLKSNYLIFFIGMLLFALLECLRQKKLRILLLVVLMAACYWGQATVPRLFIQLKTGYDMNRGMSSLSYIAMGLQENEQRASGWYNKYNDLSFDRSDFDADKQSEIVKADIRASIHAFRSGTRNPIRFFAKKTASQWNNPTFQCLWIAQIRPSAISRSAWLRGILSTSGSTVLAGYLNLLQFFILLGSWLSLFLCPDQWRRSAWILEIIVIGGFAFHLFWEAKAQYTLSYFVLLLPCAVGGYSSLLDHLCLSGDSITPKRWLSSASRPLLICCAALVLFSGLSYILHPLHMLLRPDWDANAFQRYVIDHTVDKSIPDGSYLVQPYMDSSWYLTDDPSQNDSSKVILSKEQQSVLLSSYMDSYRIRFPQTRRYLDFPLLYSGAKYADAQSQHRELTGTQEWRLLPTGEENRVYILIGENSALTYDSVVGTVRIKPFTKTDSQKWILTTSTP